MKNLKFLTILTALLISSIALGQRPVKHSGGVQIKNLQPASASASLLGFEADGAVVDLQSTLTDLNVEYTLTAISGNIFKLQKDGVDVAGSQIDLTPYLDNVEITSGTLNPTTGILTATKSDSSTIAIDLSPLVNAPPISNTSDLTNNGEDGINPFINSTDLPTALSELTDDIGATQAITLNTIFVHSISGDDTTGQVENSGSSFATLDAAIAAIPDLNSYWTIEIINTGVHELNGILPVGNYNIFSRLQGVTLSFNNNTNAEILGSGSSNIFFNIPNGNIRFETSIVSEIDTFTARIKIDADNLYVNSNFKFRRLYTFNCNINTLYLGGDLIDSFSFAISEPSIFNINKVVTTSATAQLINGSLKTGDRIEFNISSIEAIGSFLFVDIPDDGTNVSINVGNITVGNTSRLFQNPTDNAKISFIFNDSTLDGDLFFDGITSISGDLTVINNSQTYLFSLPTTLSNGKLDYNGTGNIFRGLRTYNHTLSNYIVNIQNSSSEFVYSVSGNYTNNSDSNLTIFGYCSVIHQVPNRELIHFVNIDGTDGGYTIEVYGDLSTNMIVDANRNYRIQIKKLSTAYSEKIKEILVKNKSQLLGQPLDSEFTYIIDGRIELLSGEFIEVPPAGNLTINGYGLEASEIIKNVAGESIFISPAGGSGGLLMDSVKFTMGTPTTSCFALTDATGFNAIEFVKVNFEGSGNIGYLDGYRQGLWTNIGVFGLSDGLEFRNINIGGFRSETVIVRNLSGATGTLFKAGTGLTFGSRFFSNANIDLPTGWEIADFSTSNFTRDNLFQLKGMIVTRSGVIDATDANYFPNINETNDVSVWRDNVGIRNTYIGALSKITTETITTVATANTFVRVSGTRTFSDLQHFSDGGVENSTTSTGGLTKDVTYRIQGVVDGNPNAEVSLQLRVWDESESAYSAITYEAVTQTISDVLGGNDVSNFSHEWRVFDLGEGDRLDLFGTTNNATNFTLKVGFQEMTNERK